MGSLVLLVGLDRDVVARPAGDGVEFRSRSRSLRVGNVAEGTCEALLRLQSDAVSEDDLAAAVAAADGADALASLYYSLGLLRRERFLRLLVKLSGAPLFSLAPSPAPFELDFRVVRSGGRFLLSRFALVRRDGEHMVLESPLTRSRAILHDARIAALLHALTKPCPISEIDTVRVGLNAQTIAGILSVFISSKVVVVEADQEDLVTWQFHDLLFHRYSRIGAPGVSAGGTYRFAGRLPPPPARRHRTETDDSVRLFRPDMAEIRSRGPSFALVQDARRSVRDYGSRPMTARQLGEFLYRVGRVTKLVESDVETAHGPVPMDFAWRPFPGGGALYELEVYPIVQKCGGLDPGLYHYDPFAHHLDRLAGLAPASALLLQAAQSARIDHRRVQVLLVIAAHFPRVYWKYSGIGYATILKDVGCLYQTMYLVATAMGLAPCAIGSGDSEELAAATGVPAFAEGAVGEFLLGSVADEQRTPFGPRSRPSPPEYDPLDEFVADDPHSTFRRMREDHPVYWHPERRMWFVTRFDDISAMARDQRFSAVRRRRDGPDAPRDLRHRLSVIEGFLGTWLPVNDPPDHTRLRSAAAVLFNPHHMGGMRSLISRTVEQRLDKLRDRSSFDVMSELAFPLAATTLSRLLGIPVEDLPVLKAHLRDSMTIVGAPRATEEAVAMSFRGTQRLMAYFRRAFATDGSGLRSILADHTPGEARLDERERLGLASVLLLGGYETVAYQIGNAVLALLEHPEDVACLRQHPELIGLATEEFVRYDGSVAQLLRRAGEDIDFGGTLIPVNAVVMGLIHAGNRDPTHFDDPDHLRLGRQPNRHLGFGHGLHACLGATVARAQLHVTLGAILDRFTTLQLADEGVERARSFVFRGLRTLPVTTTG